MHPDACFTLAQKAWDWDDILTTLIRTFHQQTMEMIERQGSPFYTHPSVQHQFRLNFLKRSVAERGGHDYITYLMGDFCLIFKRFLTMTRVQCLHPGMHRNRRWGSCLRRGKRGPRRQPQHASVRVKHGVRDCAMFPTIMETDGRGLEEEKAPFLVPGAKKCCF